MKEIVLLRKAFDSTFPFFLIESIAGVTPPPAFEESAFYTLVLEIGYAYVSESLT